jgi:PAS fold.
VRVREQDLLRMMELSEAEPLVTAGPGLCIPEDLPGLLRERARAVAEGVPLFRAEYRYACASGRVGWVEEQTRPVHGADREHPRLRGHRGRHHGAQD